MHHVVFSGQAERRLKKLPRPIAIDILSKLRWLSQNVVEIQHVKMIGHEVYSLHSGQYRILYTITPSSQIITVHDLGKHDEVYRRLDR